MDENRLLPIDIEHELKTSFISYAMAVIINRALPDVRDGLKPVHRRILYAMHEMGVTPDKPYKKSVRIVGDVLGKYHPHGDTAVYDSMVRMAQDFSTRYLLVDGQGNFGSEDGDGAAAMRYTEARMSKITMEMVRDIDKETVDFYPNFDESRMQPAVLPCRFPNLLVNGSGGIAVGMATNIPPHNLSEVIDAILFLSEHPDCSVEELMTFIKGPDFPTGGIVMGQSGIRAAYKTGRGRIIVRAKTEIEPMGNGRNRIVVTEIPYQVNKARLVEKIAELVHQKRIEGISDLRDESDRSGMRVVIELKRDVNDQVVLNSLFKHTQMQDTFGAIMIALVDGEPKVLNLQQMLYYYLEHQKDVITRRTRYDLEHALARAHILEGLLIALDHIDEVIRLIRSSRTAAEAKDGLMTNFGLSEKQAQAILDMRLQRLTGLEREKIEEEYKDLEVQIASFRAILADEGMVLQIIRDELTDIKNRYGDPRRTEITQLAHEIDIADLIQEESVVVTLTHFGYIKRLSSDTYRAQRRGGKGITALTTREDDFVENVFVTSTHAQLLFFTNRGRVFRLTCYEIPEAGRTAKGIAIVNLLQLNGGEKVSAVIPVEEDEASQYLVLQTREGRIKKTPLSDFENIRTTGLIAILLREEDELIGVCMTDGSREILLGTRDGMAIRFSEDDIRPMGRAASGVKAIDLSEDDEVVAMCPVDEDMQVLSITEDGYGKRTDISEYPVQSRAGKGVKAMRLTDKTGRLAGQLLVSEEEDIMLISEDGTIIRMAASDISVVGRVSQGVRLMRIDGESKVVAITKTASAVEEEEFDGDELGEEDFDDADPDSGEGGDDGSDDGLGTD